ncbi:MAG TPA: flagellar hook-associated family protein [Bauldia sp.]|nr:flagellar hook-associated family protein [Bauldia sp.]
MRTAFISTTSLLDTSRGAVLRKQAEMTRLGKEISTGRMADVGLNLGAGTGQAATLHIDVGALSALVDSNGAVVQRLRQSQTALTKLSDGANRFLQQLVMSRDSGAALGGTASIALSGFIGDANASDGDQYLFGGVNSSIAPLADYASGPKAVVDAAFTARFGFPPGDPAASSISAADMNDFLDNQFAALFADPDWGSNWSSASDAPIRNRISTTETVDTSVSANQQAIRRLAMAYTMVSGLGVDSLGTDARKAVIDKAISVLGSAIDGVTALGQSLGGTEARVSSATDSLDAQRDILTSRIQTLEGVDPAEAKVRIDTLSTQIEMSYSLTVKFLQMSILNYI